MKLQSPPSLQSGDTIGIATPSWPANAVFKEKFEFGVANMKRMNFKVKLGTLTGRFVTQGYRAGTPQERAEELNLLFADKSVKAIVTTIGGSCSVSVIEYLDFETIRKNPKVFCGYSDVTALHLALMVKAGLRTFYGPAVVPSFGEHPDMLGYSKESFLAAVSKPVPGPRELVPPMKWSNQLRDASTDGWKTGAREFVDNPGWKTLRHGLVEAPLIALNLNTYAGLVGSDVAPDLTGCILLLEEMTSSYELEERKIWQLRRSGIFNRIAGLIVSKSENLDTCGASFAYDQILLEAVGDYKFPIVTGFDCGHTHPMITVPQGVRTRLDARAKTAQIAFLEPGVQA